MDLIVCGDVLWISCGTWIAIWNGAIGAFVAALIGGLVALGVVRLTNGQQKLHAAEAREIQALADLVAQLQSVPFQLRKGTFDSDLAYLEIESALVRLELSGHGIQPVIEEMNGWPQKIALLGIAPRTFPAQEVHSPVLPSDQLLQQHPVRLLPSAHGQSAIQPRVRAPCPKLGPSVPTWTKTCTTRSK